LPLLALLLVERFREEEERWVSALGDGRERAAGA